MLRRSTRRCPECGTAQHRQPAGSKIGLDPGWRWPGVPRFRHVRLTLVLSFVLAGATMEYLQECSSSNGPTTPPAAKKGRAAKPSAPVESATNNLAEDLKTEKRSVSAPKTQNPASATTATLDLASAGETIAYNTLSPRQSTLAHEIRSMQTELEPLAADLEAAAKAIERDERWLKGSEAVLNEMERKISRWTRDYPEGLPEHIYYEAKQVQDKYNEGATAHNERIAAAQARVSAYQTKAAAYDRRMAVYEAKWAELKRIAH